MKKLFNNIALLAILLSGSTAANAQLYSHPSHRSDRIVFVDHHFDHNRHIYNHGHHYERHHDDASVAGVLVGALIGGAIVAAAEASSNSHSAQPVQPVQSTAYNRVASNYTTNLNNSIRNSNNTYSNVSSNQLQHYVNNGISYDSNDPYARITKIEATPSKTVVYFEYLRMDSNSRLGFNNNIYLKDRVTNQKLNPIACNGISMDKWMEIQSGDTHQYSVTYPAVSADCHSIDIVDPCNGGKKYYHVVF